MRAWDRFLPRRRIGTRVVAAVTAAMTTVLVLAGAFVFWRVQFALDRQLSEDLVALTQVTRANVAAGTPLDARAAGDTVQVYAPGGALLDSSPEGVPRLASRGDVLRAASGEVVHRDIGRLLPAAAHPYRARLLGVTGPEGQVFVLVAVDRSAHDEALRELLLQLGLTDVLAIAAAALVGHGVTRAALGPVERYRAAAAALGDGGGHRLPVESDRNDELTRLGHTFNELLATIEAAQVRERGFLADASHELRSPLALLAAEIEWAGHRPRTPEQLAEVLASLREQVGRLVALANSLLDLEELASREPGDLQDRRTTVRADALLAEAAAPFAATSRAQGRELVVDAPAALVHLDHRWVTLAVANLVGNALKHGSGNVRVRAAVAGDRLSVSVLDDGGGIPQTLGERAFDRFVRADDSRSTPGNGLGLALVRAVAESHGGRARLVPGGVCLELAC